MLIVDDEEDICMLVKDSLESTGDFEASYTIDPFLVEEQCRKFRPDLIVIDVVMPKRKGSEVVQALKSDSKFSDIPIIIMSGLGEMVYFKGKEKWSWLPNRPVALERGEIETDSHKAAEAYGVEEYIEKPFSAEFLISVARRVLGIKKTA